MSEYHPTTEESAENLRQYNALVQSIRKNLNPGSNTVLIVDDELAIRRKVARDVKTFDPSIVIHEAVNGKEALEKLAMIRKNYLRNPLFIVLDLNMPIMDGWTVIEKLREEYEAQNKPAGIPIIVLSSTSGEKTYAVFLKKSIHDGKSGYTPLVSVAKETCADKRRYDSAGNEGLLSWLEYFVKHS